MQTICSSNSINFYIFPQENEQEMFFLDQKGLRIHQRNIAAQRLEALHLQISILETENGSLRTIHSASLTAAPHSHCSPKIFFGNFFLMI